MRFHERNVNITKAYGVSWMPARTKTNVEGASNSATLRRDLFLEVIYDSRLYICARTALRTNTNVLARCLTVFGYLYNYCIATWRSSTEASSGIYIYCNRLIINTLKRDTRVLLFCVWCKSYIEVILTVYNCFSIILLHSTYFGDLHNKNTICPKS